MPNPIDVQREALADAGRRFTADTAYHVMAVLLDEGPYRHLRFTRVTPDEVTGRPRRSSMYWFDVVTWPGALAIRGDMGGYLFGQSGDLSPLFRGHDPNPGYWSEKLPGGRLGIMSYSDALFRQHVREVAAEREAEYPGLTAALEAGMLDPDSSIWNVEHEDGAREALAQFTFGDKCDAECVCGEQTAGHPDYEAARRWLIGHAHERTGTGHRAKRITTIEGFRFTDAWEWDLGDYSYQFLWCCHAIPWAVRQYDQRFAAVAQLPETAGTPA